MQWLKVLHKAVALGARNNASQNLIYVFIYFYVTVHRSFPFVTSYVILLNRDKACQQTNNPPFFPLLLVPVQFCVQALTSWIKKKNCMSFNICLILCGSLHRLQCICGWRGRRGHGRVEKHWQQAQWKTRVCGGWLRCLCQDPGQPDHLHLWNSYLQ